MASTDRSFAPKPCSPCSPRAVFDSPLLRNAPPAKRLAPSALSLLVRSAESQLLASYTAPRATASYLELVPVVPVVAVGVARPHANAATSGIGIQNLAMGCYSQDWCPSD
eukprot:scaffold104104_cov60-Phaeocystis_antarctica.AAC.1